MAVTFVNAANGGTSSSTTFSITIPATATNDILIVDFAHRGTGNGTMGGTSGLTWTLKHSQTFGSSFSGKTYWARATGNHATQTVTCSGLTNSCAAVLTIYRGGMQAGDPLADATVVGEANISGNETQAAISNATLGSWIVLVVANSPDLAVATQQCTAPGTLTERQEVLSTAGTDCSISHASAEKSTAGTTGNFTWTQTDAASGSWAYAIKPFGGGIPIVATAVGTSSALAVAQSSVPAETIGNASGQASASATAQALAYALGAAQGSATAVAASGAQHYALAAAQGTASVLAASAVQAYAVANAEGDADAQGVMLIPAVEVEAVATAEGVSYVQGAGLAEACTVGNAEGLAEVLAASQIVVPDSTAQSVRAGGSRRRIPRYIRVDEEEDATVPQPAVPFEPRPIAVMLPRLTSFEAGIEPHYIEMVDAANLRVKNAPPAWDEDEEWLLMQ